VANNRSAPMCLAQVCLLILFGACSDSAPMSGAVVRDSAGVRLVEHGPLTDAIAFRLGDPVYRVGWSEDDHDFVRVPTGVLLSGGRAAVGDLGTDEVIVLSATGQVEAVLGGSGQGPGEIGRIRAVYGLPGDTLVVEDIGNGRVALFHGGHFVRSYRVGEGGARLGLRGFGLQDRALFMEISTYSAIFEEPWLQAPIVRHPLETEHFDTLRYYDFAPRTSPGKPLNVLRSAGLTGVTQGAILVARGDRAQVEMLDLDGHTSQIIRWSEQRVPLSDEFWSEFAAVQWNQEQRRTEEMSEHIAGYRAAVDDLLPYMRGVRGDRAGRVWVSEFSTDWRRPTRFRVFGRDGEWLGWVHVPPRTQILDIGNDMILAVQRDELDVEAVVKLPLEPLAH
jgi:hypothetical protein